MFVRECGASSISTGCWFWTNCVCSQLIISRACAFRVFNSFQVAHVFRRREWNWQFSRLITIRLTWKLHPRVLCGWESEALYLFGFNVSHSRNCNRGTWGFMLISVFVAPAWNSTVGFQTTICRDYIVSISLATNKLKNYCRLNNGAIKRFNEL